MPQKTFEIPYAKNPIKCILTTHKDDPPSEKKPTQPSLLFTHGAGGTLQSEAIVNFVDGFTSSPSALSILCFQGNMNLQSRIKMFTAVLNEDLEAHGLETLQCLGGRSMGARAAIMASANNTHTSHLVLISYPLHTDKGDVRDAILLDIPAEVHVLFVSGDRDAMCEIERLDAVRGRMKGGTYRVVVQGADHGMNVKPKMGTRGVGVKVGEVVAEWLSLGVYGDGGDGGGEGVISWDEESEVAEWSGWSTGG
ncbi:MAG: hypothetical protein LQ350_003286 [Teloschistes chrysophthalmus]|nr:MAG: hypothetical protein LQ350_003286 [Niorma chrysophthalma]